MKYTVGELIKALKKIDKNKKITIDGFQYWGEDYYDKYTIEEEDVFWIEEREDHVRLTASPGRDWKLKTFLKYLKTLWNGFYSVFLYSLYKELKNF